MMTSEAYFFLSFFRKKSELNRLKTPTRLGNILPFSAWKNLTVYLNQKTIAVV
jgi:hypothetical protein